MLPLADLVIGIGALVHCPRLRLKNDISYVCAFAAQQLVASAGLDTLGVPLFALIGIAVALPLALASWFLIEKPSLRLKPTSQKPVVTLSPSRV